MDNGYFTCKDDENNLLELISGAQKVYERINDETSKMIYVNRLLYSLTLDIQYIRNIVLKTEVGMRFKQKLCNASMPILIYGAGKRGKELVELFPDINWKGYIDKNKRGKIGNLDIKPCEEYTNLEDYVIVISNVAKYEEIKNDLIRKGVKSNNIIMLEAWNLKAAQNQYFEPRCINMEKIVNGFVDVGCYDGTNSIQFCEKKGEHDCRVWAFEPDKIQYEICKTNLSNLKSVDVYNIAVSDKCYGGGVSLVRSSDGRSYISDNPKSDGMEVDSKSLDELLLNEKVGYIKMDTEGYENKVLEGCNNIIKNQKPALAVCIYHKRSDVLKIPNMLLEYNPNYKFAFGHYGITQAESVIYAF